MGKWLKAPIVWVTAVLTISYASWVVIVFSLRQPLGFPVSIESISSVDELAALATLPLGFFSVMAIGFAIYAVLIQKENHDETKRQFRKEFNLMLSSPVQDKYDQVLKLIESTRSEFEDAKLSHLKKLQEAKEALENKVRANSDDAFALKDPLNYMHRLPDRVFLKAMSYEDFYGNDSHCTHQTWSVNRAYRIIDELADARRLANKIYHYERISQILQAGIERLFRFNDDINERLRSYLALLDDNVDTGDSAIGIVSDAFNHCREITRRIQKYIMMLDRINTKNHNELRGFDHDFYLQVKRASDNFKEYPEQYHPAPTLDMKFKRDSKNPPIRSRNYNDLQDGYDRMLKLIFKKIDDCHPEISKNCDPQMSAALLDVFRPRGTSNPRRILGNLYSPFIQIDIQETIRKVNASFKKSAL